MEARFLHCLLIAVTFSPWLVSAQIPEGFTQYPPPHTAAALGTNIMLTCASSLYDFIVWSIDGLQNPPGSTRYDVEVRDTVNVGGEHVSVMIIPATESNNDSIHTLVCEAGTGGGFSLVAFGPPLDFTVYGLPLAPTQANLTVDTLHQLSVSWGRPFTLPGEAISYTLLIENTNTSQVETEEGLSDTSYTHSLGRAQASSCHLYLFSVLTENAVGLSVNSTTVSGIHPSAPGSFGEISSRVYLVNQTNLTSQTTDAVLELSFQTPQSCFFPLEYTVSLQTGTEPALIQYFPSGNGVTELLTVPALEEDREYTASISANNEFNFSSHNPVQTISFITSGLQSVSALQFENMTLRIVCTFAEGTTAEGCRVSVSLDRSTGLLITLARSEGELEVVSYRDASLLSEGTVISVEAQEVKVGGELGSLLVSGDVTRINPSITSSSMVATSSVPEATPTTDPPDNNSGFSQSKLLTLAIPLGVVVAILLLLIFIACCFICCCCRRNRRKDKMLAYRSSPSDAYQHNYKDMHALPVASDHSSSIREISVNPLYSDTASATKTTFEPPLLATPIPHPSNGVVAAYPSGGGGITLPSDPPPLYAEIPANQIPTTEKVVANPKYGAVGGVDATATATTNGTTDNPRYTPMTVDTKDNSNANMYASVKEPAEALAHQQLEKQYAQPYAHIPAHNGPTSNILEPEQSIV